MKEYVLGFVISSDRRTAWAGTLHEVCDNTWEHIGLCGEVGEGEDPAQVMDKVGQAIGTPEGVWAEPGEIELADTVIYLFSTVRDLDQGIAMAAGLRQYPVWQIPTLSLAVTIVLMRTLLTDGDPKQIQLVITCDKGVTQ